MAGNIWDKPGGEGRSYPVSEENTSSPMARRIAHEKADSASRMFLTPAFADRLRAATPSFMRRGR